MARTGLKFMNGLISALVTVALLVTALYAGFALWDNHQIYHAAESVFDEMKSIKAKMAAQAKADEEARIAAQKAADVNKDGTVTKDDLTRLLQYLSHAIKSL